MVTIIHKEDSEELAKTAVDILAEAVNKLLRQQGQVILAIPGGRSVVAIWKLFVNEDRIPWNNVHIFMADERVVPPDHEDSNYKLAFEMFLQKLIDTKKMPKENVHPFTPKETEDKGSSYNDELNKFGGKPDILILSSGEDGHVGALYPNHHSVKNDSDGYIVMDDSPKPPPVRMTMSRKTMLTAKTVLLLFIGKAKHEAYEKFNSGDDIIECPARLVKQIKDSYVLTDLQ